MREDLREKYEALKRCLQSYGSAAVAFSGGVDSTLLLYAAKAALGDRTLAVTVSSYLFPKRERDEAKELCRELNVRQICVKAEELKVAGFAENPANRCYLCKKDLFSRILRTAAEQGMSCVAEGSNLDDEGDYRPGLQAISELGIRSPLREAGLTKAEIRELSDAFRLRTAAKPSFACLASRFPYGETITEDKLRMVEAAEQYLFDRGFRQLRVRLHGNVARIELEDQDMERFLVKDMREDVSDRFRKIGFAYTALDLRGYRTGSLNETLKSANGKKEEKTADE